MKDFIFSAELRPDWGLISLEGLLWLWRYRRCWRDFKAIKDEEERNAITLQPGESVTFEFRLNEMDKQEKGLS